MQAFSFGDAMDDDKGSNDEVETLREGFAAVRFSKDFKQQIWNSWARVLIVKVYGRDVGFSFLQAKLLSLWKPTGRLDCVGLGYGFFLVRLSLREDYENVLKKGPWFIGRSIGNMLRIDTQTTKESRARFARLCVQIDVDKPFITTILIGRLQKPMSYKGIHRLCFGYGRRNRTKAQKSGGPTVIHDNQRGVGYQGRDRVEWRDGKSSGNDVGHIRPQREVKRKLSPLRVVEKAQLERVIQNTREQGMANLGHRTTRWHVEKGVEDQEQANKESDSSALPDSGFQSSYARPSDEDGSSTTKCDADATDKMEFEGEGALNPSFQSHIRELVQNYNPAMLVVMETWIGGERAKEITDMLPFDGAIHIETIGYVGGLWVLWNSDVVEVTPLANTK
uniref:DUF4283 domain-containing protein n=1 Tax=Quercus lobata TaxID=97700 RepID=A0A7N2MK34_QUELO